MKALLQRVRQARVEIGGEVVGAIDQGLLVLLCAEQGDTQAQADKLLAKILKLRIFSDAAGKMNLSVQDLAHGGLLIVSQFTLAADASSGNRPQLHQRRAARPSQATLRLLCSPSPHRAPFGANRPICCRYASAFGQRRACDHTVASALVVLFCYIFCSAL